MLTGVELLKRTRIKLMREHPFYGYIGLHLTFVEDNKIDTMGVDEEGYCYVNPSFVNNRDDNELAITLVHEILHLALEHPKREGHRNKLVAYVGKDGKIHTVKLFNIACDYAVNAIINKEIKEFGLYSLPRDWLYKEEFEDKSAEEIYSILEKEYSNLPKISVSIPGKGKISIPKINEKGWDKHIWEENGEKKRKGIGKNGGLKKRNIDWARITQEAKIFGEKHHGHISDGVKRDIEKLMQPKLSWKHRLRRSITSHIKNDFTWQRPARHYYSTGVYLPSMKKSEMISAIVGIDTSGSISKEELETFISEIKGIIEEYEYVDLKLIDCDSEAYNIQDISSIEKLMDACKNIRGGGGTDFRPIFEKINNELVKPKVVIIFTDLYGDFPENKPPYEVIWCVSKEGANESSDYYKEAKKIGEIIRIENGW